MSLAVVPRPREARELDGALVVSSPLRLRGDDVARGPAEVFAADLASGVGWDVTWTTEGDAQIRLSLDPRLESEHYTLEVGEHVEIRAADAAGFTYALSTLRQLGPAELFSTSPTDLETWRIPCVDVHDGPRYAWRGAHLDVARHFFSVEAVCRHLDLLALHRINRLHLHLNDDQGWRVEVPAWPRLTEVGAWRRGSPVGHEDDDVRDEVKHGGFYSASDIGRLVDHARRRQITLVPEIDLPGHAQAVLAAYPEFANVDEPLETWTHWGISEHVLNVEPGTLDFAAEVVGYVADLFPDSPVHIGGDECPSVEWARSPRARGVMAAYGFRDPQQLQGLYTERLADVLARRGRRVLAWDEVLDAATPPGTIVCAWRSLDKGVEAARRGLEVVMAPMQYLYFDWLSSDDPSEPVAVAPRPSVTTWERVFGFGEVLEALEPAVRERVLGVQCQVWTEYINSVERLDYMAFPRTCAFAEVAWGADGDLGEFTARLRTHLTRLDAAGVAYRPLGGPA